MPIHHKKSILFLYNIMKNPFKSKFMKNPFNSKIERLKEDIRKHPVCRPMNSLEKVENFLDGGKRIWLNPHDQTCFNFGWFTIKDYYDWMDGKGPIVKGETDDDKKKFWDVATFKSKYDNVAWAIISHEKDFDLIHDNYYPYSKRDGGLVSRVNKPLKNTKNNHAEIISKTLGAICNKYNNDVMYFEPDLNSNFYIKIKSEMRGAVRVLYSLGVGYYGACNTPRDIENLSWISEICLYKIAYSYFILNEIELPDFEFVRNYKI